MRPRSGTRTRLAGAAFWGFVVTLAACKTAEPEPEESTLAEFGEMLREGGAEPVVGVMEDGSTADLEGDPYAFADPEFVRELQKLQESQPEVEAPVAFEQSPYLRFGERIIVRETLQATFITKPYSLPPGRGAKLVQLIDAMRPFPTRARPASDPETGEVPALDPAMLEYEILQNWDEEIYTNLKAEIPVASAPIPLSDIFVVTAEADLLESFEEFLDLFATAGVPQIELEAKIIEIVESDTLDYGVTSVFDFGTDQFVENLTSSFSNLSAGSEGILALGAVQNSLVFNATIEALATRQNVQIDSRPRTVVRAGGVARLDSTQEIPFFEIQTLAPDGTFTTTTKYQKVGVQLYMSPRVIGSKTLALDVHVEGSQIVGTQAILSTSGALGGGTTIEQPIIAYRTAKTVVYLEPGQTLVIGGLTMDREQELTEKVPILGDIPLLGLLFRSKYTEKEKQHVLFAISPRIIQNSDLESEL